MFYPKILKNLHCGVTLARQRLIEFPGLATDPLPNGSGIRDVTNAHRIKTTVSKECRNQINRSAVMQVSLHIADNRDQDCHRFLFSPLAK
jgi:hypothetical protein